MHCISCKVEILPTFKHAVAKNECPACGGEILDEESLALIEDVEKTISSEISLREGTANKLAVTLVTKYDMTIKCGEPSRPKQEKKSQGTSKIAAPSIMQQIANGENVISETSVMKIGDMPDTISDAEREEIMAEMVSKRYGLIDGIATDAEFEEDVSGLVNPAHLATASQTGSLFTEGASNPILEQERLARLAKQQSALKSGSGAFRR
jgi:Zn-finger nucleic acid-binding protein